MLPDATRARLDPLVQTLAFLVGNSAALDLKGLLAAYDAQAPIVQAAGAYVAAYAVVEAAWATVEDTTIDYQPRFDAWDALKAAVAAARGER